MTEPSTGAPRSSASAFVAAGFFVLRTPLLPLDAWSEWSQGSGQDRESLRARLRRWLHDPVVREAIFVASPDLHESFALWEADPESERGQKVERALVRYFTRMSGRATPFGLFAANAVGRFGERTHLRLAGREALRLHTRLGMEYVGQLVEQVRARPEVRGALRYVPNTSLHASGDRLRYLESRASGSGRAYHLVGVEPQPYLLATLERAGGGATPEALARALVQDDPDVPLEEALAYVDTLVAEQILVSTWAVPICGPEPVPHLVETARDIPPLAGVREALGSVDAMLRRMDAAGPGRPPEDYRAVVRRLRELPAPVEPARLFHVDAFRPSPGLRLSPRVADELLRGVEALRRLLPPPADGPLEIFKARFAERYERRSIPLLEALDEESGVGFDFSSVPGRTTGPLLGGFAFPSGDAADPPLAPLHRHLLRRLEAAWRSGARELLLDDGDVAAVGNARPAELPDAFGILATVVAASAEAVDRGDFRVLLRNLHAPNGAVSLGRFCHGDPELDALVREYLRAEEALEPDAVFAEIVHQPPGREANVAYRPRQRKYELVLLGESGSAREDRLPLADLHVSVEDGRVVLRSRRLGREIRPRMGNVHNHGASSVGAYRFLGALQTERAQGFHFSWGPLRSALSFLPRVVYGRTVLASARWNLDAPLLASWAEARGPARFEAVQRFRAQVQLPRWVSLRDDDRQIPVDLDNALSADMLAQLVKGRPWATLEELYPGPGQLPVEGSDGRYVHELVVPFLRASPRAPVARREPSPEASVASPRRFAPGSEWLYLKLYGGPSTLDRLLAGALGEAILQASRREVVRRWFFIRYRDPHPHVRLRFEGEPARLESEVWPLLRDACARAMAEGTSWRLQLDTYEREVERYGGPAGIELVEDIFRADSEAALEILRAYPGDEGADLRWRLAFRGMDALLDDLGMTLEQKLAVVQRSRAAFGAELRAGEGDFEDQLHRRHRRERPALDALLSSSPQEPGPIQAGLVALARRGDLVRPAAARLRQEEQAGRLDPPLELIAGSLLHMHVNRMLADDQKAQELILHDFLARAYRSRQARMRR